MVSSVPQRWYSLWLLEKLWIKHVKLLRWQFACWCPITTKCQDICSHNDDKVQVLYHYSDVIIGAMASQITSLTIVYSNIYSGADKRKHQISMSLAFVWGIHQWLVNSSHKWPVTRKIFPFDDVIMYMRTVIWRVNCLSVRQTAFNAFQWILRSLCDNLSSLQWQPSPPMLNIMQSVWQISISG